MKNSKIRISAMFAIALLAVAGLQGSGKALESDAEKIYIVDSMKYDGDTIEISYTVNSSCGSSQHMGGLDFEPVTKKITKYEKLVGLKSVVYDIVQSDKCKKGTNPVSVSFSLDFKKHVAEMIERLDEDGYDVSGNYYVELPKTYTTKETVSKKPPVWEDKTKTSSGSQLPGRRDDVSTGSSSTITRRSSVKPVINVTKMEYALKWHCNLDKHSAAKRNNFDGYGSTEAEARRQAGQACAVTNAVNPNCSEMSVNPKYTTCDVNLEEKAVATQATDGVVPPGAVLKGWSCALNKNDGARRDGFSGEGATMEEAQAAAAQNCASDGNPLCDDYSLDAAHTTCGASYVLNAEKPAMNWTCVLDKHSAAKRNTFYGYGSTKEDAKQDARDQCARTNAVNPNCSQMANDPYYTSCTVELK